MNKKMMKRSLALGALMAFVITGSAMAADESYGSTMLDKDVTVSGGNLTYTADKSEIEDKKDRGYALGVTDGGSHTITLDEGKTLIVNNSLEGTDRNYGIVLSGNSGLDIKNNVSISVSSKNVKEVRALRLNGLGSSFNVDGNLNVSAKNEYDSSICASGIEAWNGGSINVSGDTLIEVYSAINDIYGIRLSGNQGKALTLNGKTKVIVNAADTHSGYAELLWLNMGTINFNDDVELIGHSDGTDSYVDGMFISADHSNAYDSIINFNGKLTNIDIDSNYSGYGMVISGGRSAVNLNGEEVNIKLKTTEAEAIGMLSQYGAIINSVDHTTINMDIRSSEHEARGIILEEYAKYNGNVNLLGNVNITANSKAGSIGIFNYSDDVNAKGEAIENADDGKAIIGGDLVITSSSAEGTATGIYSAGDYAVTTVLGNVNITADDYALFATENGVMNIGSEGKKIVLSGDVSAQNKAVINLVGDSEFSEANTEFSTVNDGVINLSGGNMSGSLNIAGGSNVNLTGATFTASDLEASLTGEGKLVISGNGKLETMSGQIFENGIDQTSDKTVLDSIDSGKINDIASSKLEFIGGSVVLNDAKYSDAYLNSAKDALGKDTLLIMNGTLVTKDGVENESSVENVAGKGENVIQNNVTAQSDKNLLIGQKLDSVDTVEGVEIKDSVANGFGVSDLDMAAGSTGLVITDDAKVTLAGNNGELVTVGGEVCEELDVIVGTTEMVGNAVSMAGTLNIGNDKKDSTLTGNVIVNGKDSSLNVNGNVVIKGDLTLNSGSVNAVGGTLDAIVIVTEDSTITGSVSGILSVEKDAVLNVGTANASASTSFENVNLNGSSVCFDPDWDKAAGQHGWKFDEKVDGNVLVARNNYVAIGTSETEAARTMFEKTGLKFGEKDITAVLYIAGNQSLYSGVGAWDPDKGSIYVDGSKTGEAGFENVKAGTFGAAANSLTMVDGSEVQNTAALSGIKESSIDKGAKLYIDGAKKGETYKILAGTGIDGVWELGNVISDNGLLKFEAVQGNDKTKFDVIASLKKVNDVYDNKVVIGNVVDYTLDKHEDSDAADFFNKAVSDKVNASKDAQISALNSAGAMSELAGVAHSTYAVSNILTDAVADHVSLSNELDHDTDIWAHYVHNKENVKGLSVANFGADYDAQYNGIVVGGDFYKKDNVVAGAALTYVDGNINGSTLAARTENDAEYYGVSVYGSVTNDDNAVIGDISYLHGKHEITQSNSGFALTGEPESDAFSVGVRVEKAIETEAGKFVPYAGVRYMHVGTANYTNSIGMSYDADDASLFLLPVGLKYSAETKAGKWTIRPVAELGYVWAMGDTDSAQTVSLNGAADGFGYDVTDEGSYFARIGVEAVSNNVTYGLGYEYQKGDSVKANKWMANLNFSF